MLVRLGENSTERLGMDGDSVEKKMAGVAGLDVGVGVGKVQSGAGEEQEKQEGNMGRRATGSEVRTGISLSLLQLGIQEALGVT